MQQFYSRYMSLRSLQVPLVAALNGPAIGAGLCISLFADVRVAAKDAKLGFTFVNLGLHPVSFIVFTVPGEVCVSHNKFAVPIGFQGMACSHFLPLLVGPETANYLLLTGKVQPITIAVLIGLSDIYYWMVL